jgi:hypothetical protein
MHPAMDVHDVLALSDLVVVGQVEQASSGVTKNKDFVSTTYSLRVDKVLFNRHPESRVPGAVMSTIQFSHPGGHVMFDSRRINAVDLTLRPFPIGLRLVLFLWRDSATPETFTIVDGPYGAFSADSGRVKSFLEGDKHIKEPYDGTDLLSFETFILNGGLSHR